MLRLAPMAAMGITAACAPVTPAVPPVTAAIAAPAPADEAVIPLIARANEDVIVAQADFAPGQAINAHRHLGVEIVHALAGETRLQFEGQPWRTVPPGETVVIPAGTYHRAAAGPAGAKFVVFRIHQRGQPLRIPPDRPVRFPE